MIDIISILFPTLPTGLVLRDEQEQSCERMVSHEPCYHARIWANVNMAAKIGTTYVYCEDFPKNQEFPKHKLKVDY